MVVGLRLPHFDSAVSLYGNREAVEDSQGKATWLSHVLGRNKGKLGLVGVKAWIGRVGR